jgi:hypothetical protein
MRGWTQNDKTSSTILALVWRLDVAAEDLFGSTRCDKM